MSSEPNDFEDVENDDNFDDDDIVHEELKDDDPPPTNDEIPTMEDLDDSATTTATTKALATKVVELVLKEVRDSEGTMTLLSVFSDMVAKQNTSTITRDSFVSFVTSSFDESTASIDKVYREHLCVKSSDRSSKTFNQGGPGFVEFYLFATRATKKQEIMRAVDSVRSSMMTTMTATSSGDFGLGALFKKKLKNNTTVDNQEISSVLKEDAGMKISQEDWVVLAPSFPNPILSSAGGGEKEMHWPSFVAVVDPKGKATETVTETETKETNPSSRTSVAEKNDDDGSDESPLRDSWRLLPKYHGEMSVDYRFSEKEMTRNKLKKLFKKKDVKYTSEQQDSVDGCFDVHGDGMLDVSAYANWSMRRALTGSPEFLAIVLKLCKTIDSKEKDKKGVITNTTKETILDLFIKKMDVNGTMSEKDFSVALKKASPTKSEIQVLVAELQVESAEDEDEDEDEEEDKKKKKKKKNQVRKQKYEYVSCR